MKTFYALALCLATTLTASASVPGIITYQGRVTSNGTNFTGTGYFRFVLFRPGPPISTVWSHNGSSVSGGMPGTEVAVEVVNGLFTVALGDTTYPGMTTAIPESAFNTPDVRLRIWFNDGVSGVAQLSPDQRISASAYSMMSATVPNGSITVTKLAPGFWNPTNFPANSIGSAQIADTLELGAPNTPGRLDVYRTSANTPAVSLIGASSQISTYGSDGLEQIRLWGASWGEILLNNSLAGNDTAVRLSANDNAGGFLSLNNSNGVPRASLSGGNAGGQLTLSGPGNNVAAYLDARQANGGLLNLRNADGANRVTLSVGSVGGALNLFGTEGSSHALLSAVAAGGSLNLRNTSGANRAILAGTTGGTLTLYQDDGDVGAILYGNEGGGGALSLRATNGAARARLYGAPSSGLLQLYNETGVETVRATAAGDGDIRLRHANGNTGMLLLANNGTGGGGLSIYRTNGTFAGQFTVADNTRRDGFFGLRRGNDQWGITMRGQNSATGGGAITLYNSAGAATVRLDASSSNEGRIWTEALTITGGSDLSESFNICEAAPLEPGMVVCIDPAKPGDLILSREPYDPTVAGIISGAGGVKTGMLMGQAGSIADGKHPVALTGRVYCWVDADAGGPVRPGDLLTTCATAGHAMKAADRDRAFGAVIGKAMTSLESGRGLVLVLVSLQ